MDSLNPDFVNELFHRTTTNSELAQHLRESMPGARGFSLRSVERYCEKNGLLRRANLPDDEVDNLVADSVNVLGQSAGRNYVQGHLRARRTPVVCDKRIRKSMARLFPDALRARRTGPLALRLAPRPYRADYVGHRIHMDQNEKLTAYGVTLVAAIDGHSGYILKAVAMPLKNAITVYDAVFRPIIMHFGLFDQVIVDKGGEFFLSLSVQQSLMQYRTCHERQPDRPPYRQIPSVKNNRIERFWVEVNARIHEPIIVCIESLVDTNRIDLNSAYYQFAVSQASLRVVQAALNEHVSARNNRTVRGRGIPANLIRDNRAAQINSTVIPVTATAAQAYNSAGGHLKNPKIVGLDPLRDDLSRKQRDANIPAHLLNFSAVFSKILERDYNSFFEIVHHFVSWAPAPQT